MIRCHSPLRDDVQYVAIYMHCVTWSIWRENKSVATTFSALKFWPTGHHAVKGYHFLSASCVIGARSVLCADFTYSESADDALQKSSSYREGQHGASQIGAFGL